MDPSLSSMTDGAANDSPRPSQRLFLPAPDPCSPPLTSELARLAAVSKPAAQHSNPPAAAVDTDSGTGAAQSENPTVAVTCSAPVREASQRTGCVSAASLSHALACAASMEATRPTPLAAGHPSEQLASPAEAAAAREATADAEDGERFPAGVSAAETAAMIHLVSGLRPVASGDNVVMTLPKAESDEEGVSDGPRTPRKVSGSAGRPPV